MLPNTIENNRKKRLSAFSYCTHTFAWYSEVFFLFIINEMEREPMPLEKLLS